MKTEDTGTLTKGQKTKLNDEFVETLAKWRQTNDPDLWDDIFERVLTCANHLMSKMAPFREDRYDIAEDATLLFMTKIRDGVKEGPGRRTKDTILKEFNPKSLPTMLRFEIVHLLYRDQQKFEDSMISLEEYQENLKKQEEGR